jgi:hypothetical protein
MEANLSDNMKSVTPLSAAPPGTRRTPMVSRLTRRCSALLHAMFDERRCLFAYSTTLQHGRYINNYDHPAACRYTINCLAGLQRAKIFQEVDWNIELLLDRFLTLHWTAVTNYGDNGLLLYVLAVAAHPKAEAQLSRIERITNDDRALLTLNIQEICWMLAGLTKYAEVSGTRRAIAATKKCWTILSDRYVDQRTLLPYYSLSRFRPGFTSFGGIAYFLWSVYDYARTFDDEQARATFKASVQQVMKLQGSRGEWPWFINATNASVLDWYELYSVHQDSMSMLFLLPALDSGVVAARTAIENSYRWVAGTNELGAAMILEHPFFVYRSIRQNTRLERQKRYLRALGSRLLGWQATIPTPSSLEIDRECRSYHIGWLLFAWADRQGWEEFTELRVLHRHSANQPRGEVPAA